MINAYLCNYKEIHIMIKRLSLLIILVLSVLFINAQAKRYIFMEHFTNTWCSICGSQNPKFYSVLKNYEGNYHHMTIHPSFPYNQCPLYNANKTENSLRANYYSVSSTPTIVVNGLTSKSASSVKAAYLNSELGKTSPIQLIVKETGTSNRSISVEVLTLGNKPAGTYKIYAAALEKVLNFNAQNGEKVHQNVFRKFVSSADGDVINLAEAGGVINLNYNLNIDPTWVESQMYVLVWVQNINTKEVMNSGNKFDITSSVSSPIYTNFQILTNPVKQNLVLQLDRPITGEYIISNIMGQTIEHGYLPTNSNRLDVLVSNYKKGLYLVRIQSGNLKTTKRWVKD